MIFATSKLFIAASLAVTLVTGAAHAQAQDKNVLEEVTRAYGKLPQNEKELVQKFRDDLAEVSGPYLEDLVRNSSLKDAEAFVEALDRTEDPEVLSRLATRLEANEETTLRLYSLIRARIESDPAKLKRMQQTADLLHSHLEEKNLPKLAIGQRSYNAFVTVGALVGIMYGYWVDISKESMLHQTHFIDKMHYAPIGFAALFAMSSYNDVKALMVGWKEARRAKMLHKQAMKSVRNLQEILSEIKQSPAGQATLQTAKYYVSAQAEKDRAQALPELTKAFIEEIEFLKTQGMAGQMEAFTRTKAFFALVKELRESLSETEKRALQQKANEAGITLPLGLNPKVLLFEHKIKQQFQDWLASGGKDSDMRKTLLRQDEKDTRRFLELTHMSPGAEWSIWGATIALTIVGVQAGIGNEPGLLDTVFTANLMDWIRDNAAINYTIAKFAVLTPLAYQTLEFGRKAKRAWSERKDAISLSLERYMLLLNQSKASDGRKVELMTADYVIDNPAAPRAPKPPRCEAIFMK